VDTLRELSQGCANLGSREAEQDAYRMSHTPGNPKVSRRLAAILAADIAGYSALMGMDEEASVRDLKAHQAIVLPMISEHGGRVIDTAGDGILAEFASAVNAVKCAAAIQSTMAERNAAANPARRMQFRIGVNLGDVVFDDARIYGDGVNVAARLEAIAEPGGICISDKVRLEIRGKVDVVCQDIGEQHLKNITEPVRVYRINVGTVPSPSLAKPALTLPDKPSIAVLPFINMSGDPNQEYFSDGITEDIITELSRFSDLFVIARNSSFQYKGKSPDIRQVGRELGVRYVLEGSIRRAGDRVRITGQLVDATTGAHRWAERYDRKLEDIFAVQDELARTIAPILAVHVNKAEIERTLTKPETSWQAYDWHLRAVACMASFYSSWKPKELYDARRYLEASLSVDPTYARAYTTLSFTYTGAFSNPADGDYANAAALEQGYAFAQKAVQIDPYLPQAHAQLGMVLIWKRRHEAAIASFERAISLNPNFSDWRFIAGLMFAGESERALTVSDAYLRLDPFHPASALLYIGAALLMLRKHSDAVVPLLNAASRSPNTRGAYALLSATYAHLGQLEDARAAASDVLRIEPDYTIGRHRGVFAPFRKPEDAEHLFNGLRKAGLPE
jgi:adenylate cyclase